MEEYLYPHFYAIELKHWWFVARQRILQEFLRKQVHLAQGARILDVGCGTGAIVDMFSQRYEVYGQDVSPQAIEFCRKRGLKNLYCGPLDQYVPDGKFDLITSLDVIEHIDDDVKTLKKIRTLLSENGLLLITVPAFPMLWGPHDIITHHKRRYLKRTLRAVVEQAGFSIEYISYFNFFLFPVAIVRRVVAKLFNMQEASDLDLPAKPINAMLRVCFESEARLLPAVKFPFGLSLICVGRNLPSCGV